MRAMTLDTLTPDAFNGDEFGLCSDEGAVMGDIYSYDAARKALIENGAEEDDSLYIARMCEHECDADRCEECNGEDEECEECDDEE